VRDHVGSTASDVELANDRRMGALQDFDDFAIGAAIGLDTRNADDYSIAMHGLLGRFGRDENVAGDAGDRGVGDEKAVAVAVHIEAADGELAAQRGDGEMAGTKLDELASGGEARQGGLKGGALFALVA